MLKKILLLLCMGSCYAQDKLPQSAPESITVEVPCFDTDSLFNDLKQTYKEVPILTGKAEDAVESTMSFWIQPVKNGWTIVATKGTLSCVIGYGKGFSLVPHRKGNEL